MGDVQILGLYGQNIVAESVPEQITITEAPEKSRVSLELLMLNRPGFHFRGPDRLLLGDPIQVEYRIVGFDNGTLLVERDSFWTPRTDKESGEK